MNSEKTIAISAKVIDYLKGFDETKELTKNQKIMITIYASLAKEDNTDLIFGSNVIPTPGHGVVSIARLLVCTKEELLSAMSESNKDAESIMNTILENRSKTNTVTREAA